MAASVRARRRARLVGGLALFVAVLAVFAVPPLAGSLIGPMVRARVGKLAARAGVTIELGAVSVGVHPIITVRDVRVAYNGQRLASVDRLTADLPWIAALRGARRPRELTVAGLRATVHLRDGRSAAFQAIRRRWREASAPAGPRTAKTPIRLRLVDGQVDIQHGGAASRWVGATTKLTDLEVDMNRAGGWLAATVTGAVRGRVHALVERDSHGDWMVRAEAAPALTWRAPPGLPLAVERGHLRGVRWQAGRLHVADLYVASTIGDVRVAQISSDRRGQRVLFSGVHVRARPAGILPRSLRLDGELHMAIERLQVDGARALRRGGRGSVTAQGVSVRADAYNTRGSLRYGRLERLAAPPGGTAEPLSLRLHSPRLVIGDLANTRLPPQLRPVAAALTRLAALWAKAHKAPRTTRNGAGWARPIAPELTSEQRVAARRLHRRLRRLRHRQARGKPAFTARYAAVVAALPVNLDRAWRTLSNLMQRAATRPLRVDVVDGAVTAHAGTLSFGADHCDVRWRAAGALPTLRARLRPVVDGRASGQIEGALVADDTGLLRADIAVEGSALARLATGLDRRLATGPAPDLRFSASALAQAGGGGRITGRVGLRDVGVDWDRFAPGPVTRVAADGPFELRWPSSRRTLSLRTGHIRFGGSTAEHRGRATVSADLSGGERPVINVTFGLPDQDCGALVRALPTVMLPTLGEVSAQGRLSGWLDLRLDVAHPYYSEIAFALHDKKCRDLKLKAVDIDHLNDDFSRPVNEDGTLLTDVRIGPLSHAWVDFGKLPPWVPYAMITTEDGGFWRHHGLNAFLLNRAIRLDLHYGRFVYGGSTITQQLAKNLFFTRSKFLARKFEELIAVWAMERTLTKPRIIEIYMNAVEFAPHIYGVVRGAMHYFGKRPSRLSPLEAAWLGSIKPCPRCGDSAFRHLQYRAWYQTRLLEILTRMHRNEVITDAQFEAEANTVPKFFGWPAEKLSRRFTHPVPEKKPPAIQRLDRGRGTSRRRRHPR